MEEGLRMGWPSRGERVICDGLGHDENRAWRSDGGEAKVVAHRRCSQANIGIV